MSFLTRIFGASQKESWQLLSKEIGGTYVPRGFWRWSGEVHTTHDEWPLTLDTYVETIPIPNALDASQEYTCIRAPYVSKDGFRFAVYRRGFYRKLFRMPTQDVEVGHEEFDRDFIIQGNDEEKLRMLFRNSRIRDLVSAQPVIFLTVKDNAGNDYEGNGCEGWTGVPFPEGVHELQFRESGRITDVDRLKLLFDLFGEILDELRRMRSDGGENPKPALVKEV